MKVPLSWLKDYVEMTLPPHELAERLTVAGLEVEGIEWIGVPATGHYAETADHLVWERDHLVVGAIHEVKPHPNADRLVLAMVDYGGEELEQVVTGAPNLFDYAGQGELDPPLKAPFAMEGSELYNGHIEGWERMTLSEATIRGIPSRSMVCSEKELGLSEEHEGIMLLQTDAPPGTPLQDVLGDVVLDIHLTPNLARCFNMIGVARETSAITGAPLRLPDSHMTADDALPAANDFVKIEIEDAELSARYCATIIKGIEVKPSPQWMQRRLKRAGMRPINNIVDITNYVMLEWGQPLHAFDYDLLKARADGAEPTIIVRPARDGETMTTLDGQPRTFNTENLLITDTAGPIAVAGVMGGSETEVGAQTQNVLLESANFNFISIRKTSVRDLKIPSESSTRFGRGVHPALTIPAVQRASELMRIYGGPNVQIAPGVADNYPAPPPTVQVTITLDEIERVVGMRLSLEDVTGILKRLDFDVTAEGETIRATVPDHRLDISPGFTGKADLIEEVTRVYGYDRIPDTMIEDAMPPQRGNPELEAEESARDLLVRLGLTEVVNYRPTTPEREAMLYPEGTEAPDAAYVEIANPISVHMTVMRRTLLPAMLEVAANNARHHNRINIFEVGRVYHPVEGELLPEEPHRIAILMMGPRGLSSWQGETDAGLVDFYDLKGVGEGLVEGLHVERAVFEAAEHPTWHPGRAARLVANGEPAGYLGELHPLVRRAYELPEVPVMIAELDLDALFAAGGDLERIVPVPRYEGVYEDIALIVDEATPAAEVAAVIRNAGGDALGGVRLFDVYTGAPIPEGKKSLAYALTYLSDEATLSDRQAAKIRKKIVKAAKKKLGAELRSQ